MEPAAARFQLEKRAMSQTFKPRLGAHCAKILLVGFTALTLGGALPAQPADELQLAYLVNFHNGALEPSVDKHGFKAMAKGHSEILNSNPTWTKQGGALEMAISKPVGTSVPASAGVWTTPVNFGPGSKFAIEATFVRPDGPHDPTNVWAVALSARTGGVPDLPALTRAAATLQVRADKARLNAPGITPPLNLDNLDSATYNRIFRENGPASFTLTFLVDRSTGKGTATLKVGDVVISKQSELTVFKATSGDPITAVGAAIVLASGDGKRASVQIREFRILTPKSSG
jgi:hypothetical protein